MDSVAISWDNKITFSLGVNVFLLSAYHYIMRHLTLSELSLIHTSHTLNVEAENVHNYGKEVKVQSDHKHLIIKIYGKQVLSIGPLPLIYKEFYYCIL